MKLVGDYSNAHFAGSADGNGTLITLNANDDAPAFPPTRPQTAGSRTADHHGIADADTLRPRAAPCTSPIST